MGPGHAVTANMSVRRVRRPGRHKRTGPATVAPGSRDPGDNRAVILWCDVSAEAARATGRHGSPKTSNREAHLRRYVEEGWPVFGVTWLPEIAEGTMSPAERPLPPPARAAGHRHRDSNTPVRPARPAPQTAAGPGVVLRYHLDPARCVTLGSGSQDPASRCRAGGLRIAPRRSFSARYSTQPRYDCSSQTRQVDWPHRQATTGEGFHDNGNTDSWLGTLIAPPCCGAILQYVGPDRVVDQTGRRCQRRQSDGVEQRTGAGPAKSPRGVTHPPPSGP